jgi:hypothetical protein
MDNIINAAQIENDLVINVLVVTDIDFIPNLVEIPDGSSAGIGWSYIDGEFIAPVVPETTAEENKVTAVGLLQATDWTTIADVGNPDMSNPYLANQAEFIAWRSEVRAIAVTPVAGTLPVLQEMPQEDWQTV